MPASDSDQPKRDHGVTSVTLIQKIRSGDESAWMRMVDLYTPLVCHWCQRWGLQSADVDDVAQDVFVTVSKNIESFRKEYAGDTFRGWLRGIARNKLYEFNRRSGSQATGAGGDDAQRRIAEIPDEPNETGDDPADAEQISALFRRVLDAIRTEFEPKTWQAFWRVAMDEVSTADVADELKMSTSAIRMAKSRVLRRLREECGDIA